MAFRSSLFAAAAALMLGASRAGDPSSGKEELCSLVPYSYASAKQSNPEIAFALDEVEKHSIASWYSDRNADYTSLPQRLVDTCSSDKRLSVVVYGLPNKDCEGGYSSSGQVQNKNDYVLFLQRLIDTIKDRKVLYVLEPDAVGLLAKEGGCGEAASYRDNLKTAIQMLSQNPNAEIYLDVGYWSLAYDNSRQRVVEVVESLTSGGGRVKGITLNTSNYRKTSEIADLCSKFQNDISGTAHMNCIIDTSRNYRGSPSTEWCNVGSAGIGQPPTANTGLSNIDYFLWLKPAGESDGTCDGSGHTADSLRGPPAGDFFVDGFKKLWDNGYFVDSMNMASFDGSAPAPTPDPTSIFQIGTPVTPEPTTVTPAPDATTPAPDASTPAPQPTTVAPETTTPAPQTTPETTTPAPQSTPVTTTPAPQTTPETTTPAPQTTTPAPAASTPAPDATTSSPQVTTPAPQTTSPSPVTTTPAPQTTTASPSVSTPAPVNTPVSTTVTPVPSTTTVAPGTSTTDIPAVTPTATTPKPTVASSSGSSFGSPSVGSPTPRPSFRPSKKPKPTTSEPTTAPPASSDDVAQNTTPAVDGGPETIGANPGASEANTKSSGMSSGTGGIIAAVLIAAVALAVAAAMFIHVRRRAQDVAADEMKTPVSLDPAHPAYLSQL